MNCGIFATPAGKACNRAAVFELLSYLHWFLCICPLLSHPPLSPPPQHFILPARLGNTSLSGSELIAVGWRVLSREAMGASERERQREADFRLPLQFQERMQPIMIQDVPGKGQLKLQQA